MWVTVTRFLAMVDAEAFGQMMNLDRCRNILIMAKIADDGERNSDVATAFESSSIMSRVTADELTIGVVK